MAAFWAVFTCGGSGPAITAHGSLDHCTRNSNSNSNLLILFCYASGYTILKIIFI
jgi:hypothetical protein